MGTSKGTEMEPTLSGGTGRSGTQGRGPHPALKLSVGSIKRAATTIVTSTNLGVCMTIPQYSMATTEHKRLISRWHLITTRIHLSRKVDARSAAVADPDRWQATAVVVSPVCPPLVGLPRMHSPADDRRSPLQRPGRAWETGIPRQEPWNEKRISGHGETASEVSA